MVKEWLKICDDKGINPWEYNFINEYINRYSYKNQKEQKKLNCDLKSKNREENEKAKVDNNNEGYGLLNKFNLINASFTDVGWKNSKSEEEIRKYICDIESNSIKKYLRYKNKEFGGLADCDKEAFPIYKVLKWQEDKEDIVRGDTMNSLWTTYKCYLQIEYPDIFMPDGYLKGAEKLIKPSNQKNPNLKYPPFVSRDRVHKKYIEYYKENKEFELKIDKTMTWIEFLIANFAKFIKVHENKELLKFTKLNHTIGNFIVLSYWMNKGRNNRFQDYWDLTMEYLYNTLEPLDAWKKFIDKYYMWSYLNEDLICNYYWNRNKKNNLPQNENEILEFLKIVNECIEIRGKMIIQILRNTMK